MKNKIKEKEIPKKYFDIWGNVLKGCLLSGVWGPPSFTKKEYTSADLSFLDKVSFVYIQPHAFQCFENLSRIRLPHTTSFFGYMAFAKTKLVSKTGNYKAFEIEEDGRLFCSPTGKRKHYYKVGRKSIVRGDIELCENGIHYCTNLFDNFNYYAGEYGKDFVIAECEVSKENIGGEDCEDVGVTDSKRCARWIIPTRVLSREEVISILNGEE